VFARLGVDPATGLADEEATRRRDVVGPNDLPTAQGVRWPAMLARQFVDPLVALLAVAAALSILVGEHLDAGTILAILVLNAALGFGQEWRAERALEALRKMLAPRAQVLRGGLIRSLPAASLVPGDVVEIAAGGRVPADLRLIRVQGLRLDEAALTGESVPISKVVDADAPQTPLAEQRALAFMGTTVVRGGGVGVVVATGIRTEFGQVAALTDEVETAATPLRRHLVVLGRQIGALAVSVSAGVALLGWALGRPLDQMVMTAISLAVGAIPEGLPAMVTVTLALGTRALVRRRVLLRRLAAAESLGAVTTICTDKTGTLTGGSMTVAEIVTPASRLRVTGRGYQPHGQFLGPDGPLTPDEATRRLLETGLCCNHARLQRDGAGWSAVGDPTEIALVVAARKASLPTPGEVKLEHPFTAARRRMSVVIDGTLHLKGAPEEVLPRCSGSEAVVIERAVAETHRMAGAGLRVLALARRELPRGASGEPERDETGLTFLGLVGMIDPPRPEVPGAVRSARAAGIRVLVVTGDAGPTGNAIAREVGLTPATVLTGVELSALTDDDLDRALTHDPVLARVTPAEKLRVVTRLQAKGEIVAMTGDGINDAPALKRADVGVAMGQRGTDVARGAADVVILDDDFTSIVAGVEEGRRQRENIRRFVRYLLSSNVGELAAVAIGLTLGGPLLLTPIQILWLNLISDGVTAAALAGEPPEPGTMQRPPPPPEEPLLGRPELLEILGYGCWMATTTVAIYLLERGQSSAAVAQTAAFSVLVVMGQLHAFNFRVGEAIRGRQNPWLPRAAAAMLIVHLLSVYLPIAQQLLGTAPLGLASWGRVIAVSLPVLLVPELWRRLRAGTPHSPDPVVSASA